MFSFRTLQSTLENLAILNWTNSFRHIKQIKKHYFSNNSKLVSLSFKSHSTNQIYYIKIRKTKILFLLNFLLIFILNTYFAYNNKFSTIKLFQMQKKTFKDTMQFKCDASDCQTNSLNYETFLLHLTMKRMFLSLSQNKCFAL